MGADCRRMPPSLPREVMWLIIGFLGASFPADLHLRAASRALRSDFDLAVGISEEFTIEKYSAPSIARIKRRREALASVKRSGLAVAYESEELKNDKDVALAAVKENGHALRHLSRELRNDKDVALAAVKENGDALLYLSEELKNDKDVALAAVKRNGLAVDHLIELKNDKDVALAAVKRNGLAVDHLIEPKFDAV